MDNILLMYYLIENTKRSIWLLYCFLFPSNKSLPAVKFSILCTCSSLMQTPFESALHCKMHFNFQKNSFYAATDVTSRCTFLSVCLVRSDCECRSLVLMADDTAMNLIQVVCWEVPPGNSHVRLDLLVWLILLEVLAWSTSDSDWHQEIRPESRRPDNPSSLDNWDKSCAVSTHTNVERLFGSRKTLTCWVTFCWVKYWPGVHN